ncbi:MULTISPECIES: Gfo/Idh/MocA family protein [unclassified Oleiphilus]|uniref:Gfo/Idh/MocA family oxidoreductase n=1 Tax=unclassified Oleiphilus TaxID=2631174 RepID=UPI0007C40C39|nr:MULTISPECIES: Gfo/Idh/MocA family oxidoreductase [unclassified Oleiphilus]KZZ32956.1 oxidoreductase [Oleiphilus sp. HI0117]KZZ55220.1 oxidoreductase [Oleiphilus sp. HI0123]
MGVLSKKQCFSLGFIGGSVKSAVGYTHKIASQVDGRWEVAAGCFSRDFETNLETANEWGISSERTYADFHFLLENEKDNLDAIVILTPTPSHTEIVIEAINKGYAVICEKALTATSDEALLIAESVRKNKGFLAVTLNYTGYPMLRELKHLISVESLGAIKQIQIEMPQEGFMRLDAQGNKPQPQAWRLSDGKVSTISLDLGVHLHHIVDYLTGERPLQVVADAASYGWFDDVIDNVSCMLRYSGGMNCQMWYSKSALGQRNGLKIRVYGDKGSAEWFQMQPEELLIATQDGRREILDRASLVEVACSERYNRFKAGHPAGFIEAFANIYYDLADAYSEFRETGSYKSNEVFGVSHAVNGLRLFEAIVQSGDESRWVSLPNEEGK